MYYKKVKTKQSIAFFFHFSTFQRICVRVPRDLRNCQKFTRITFDFMSNFDRCEVSLSTGPEKKKIHCDDSNFGKFSFSFVTFVSIHTLIEDKVCASNWGKFCTNSISSVNSWMSETRLSPPPFLLHTQFMYHNSNLLKP